MQRADAIRPEAGSVRPEKKLFLLMSPTKSLQSLNLSIHSTATLIPFCGFRYTPPNLLFLPLLSTHSITALISSCLTIDINPTKPVLTNTSTPLPSQKENNSNSSLSCSINPPLLLTGGSKIKNTSTQAYKSIINVQFPKPRPTSIVHIVTFIFNWQVYS